MLNSVSILPAFRSIHWKPTHSSALLNMFTNAAAEAPVGRKWASFTVKEKQLHKASPCSSCSSGYSFSSYCNFSSGCSFSFSAHLQPLPNCFSTYTTQGPLHHLPSSLHCLAKRDVSVLERALRLCTFKVLLDSFRGQSEASAEAR